MVDIRQSKGQSIIVSVPLADGTVVRYTTHSPITIDSKESYSNTRSFGAMNDTGATYNGGHSEVSLDSGGSVYLSEQILLLSANLGKPTKTVLESGLIRYSWTVKTYKIETPIALEFARGNKTTAEGVTGAVGSAFGLNVKVGGGSNSLTGTLLGSNVEYDWDMGLTAVQRVHNITDDYTITTAAGVTSTILENAPASAVANALNAVLGAGTVIVFGQNNPGGAGFIVKFVGVDGLVAPLTATNATVTVLNSGAPIPELPSTNVSATGLNVCVGGFRPDFDSYLTNANDDLIATSFEHELADRVVPFYAAKGANTSPLAFLSGEPKASTKSWLDGNAAGKQVAKNARKTETQYHSGVCYREDGQGWQVHARSLVTDPGSMGDDSGAYGYTPTFTSQHDDVWGGSQIICVDTDWDIDL